MSFRRILAVLKKQIKETLKNKAILIQFALFPILTLIVSKGVTIDNLPDNYFVILFGTMYMGMAPVMSSSSIIAEEKECNTLRVLLMSNVKAAEYLIGTCSYVVALCVLGSAVIGLAGDFSGDEFVLFIVFMFIGVVISTVLGALVGICSKNQVSAVSISVPLMVILAFLPMLATFNDKIADVSRFFYPQQLNNWISEISHLEISLGSLIIVFVNAVVVFVGFGYLYMRKGLE